jgi:predicted 2-oxoglutarate/Fe(II)-dependent dioxygenase YbiX
MSPTSTLSKSSPPFILPVNGPEPDFRPDANAPCFCGGGETFANCCGSTRFARPPPYGLFMFENYLDADLARELTAFAEQRDGQRLMVIDNKASTPDRLVKVEDERRVAERVDMGERRTQLNEIVKNAFVDLAGKCMGERLQWFEAPDLMRYRQGGYYVRHADSHNMDLDTGTWSKVIDRDLSMLIYLNDGYEGGELSFYKFNYQIRPRAGAAVLFPSDYRYLHAAEVVTKGVRYAIVSWASLLGVPKVAGRPPEPAIFVE